MSTFHVQQSAQIDAPPQKVYDIIANYHEGHQAILPRRYFQEMIVKEGGIGNGTRIIVKMDVYGAKATYDMVVTEPEPGRVLKEEDKSVGTVTTFTVDPIENGAKSHVTIATTAKASNGFKGFIERMMNPPVMRRIYREELQQLAEVAQKA